MKMSKNFTTIIFLCSLFAGLNFLTGCLSKPYFPGDNPGTLHLSIQLAESGVKARAEEIKEILVKVENSKKKIVKEQVLPFAGSPLETSFSSLYPGEWLVSAAGTDASGHNIFQGECKVMIEPGSVKSSSLYLRASPGRLNVRFDASGVPGFGVDFSEGRLYLYLNPESGSSTSYSMQQEGDFLTTEVSVPEGTFQAKIAVPNTTNAVYQSPYYTVNIRAGQTTYLSILPDGSLNVTGVIDSTPATPGNLRIDSVFHDQINDDYLIILTWTEVAEPDLEGYFLYRSDDEGRFSRIASLGKVLSYTDTVSASYFFQNRVGYAVSSYDRGGNESFWSQPVYYTKE